MNVLNLNESLKVPSFECYSLTFEIFLLYHIRKYVDKNYFSLGPLHVYSGAVKKDHLTIDYYVHV